MAITPVPPLDRTSPTFRGDVDTFFGSRMPQMVGEINALAANLNSIAAGGAYAIPYTVGIDPQIGASAGGFISFSSNAGAQNAATTLFMDSKDAAGKFVGPLLVTFGASTSAVKGHIRVVKAGDPTRWIVFRVLSMGGDTTYQLYGISAESSSSAYPFEIGDSVLVYFQRTGDKGDTGAQGPLRNVPYMKVMGFNDFGASPVGDVIRALNSTHANSISGASLANNTVTLPAGTYRVRGRSPAQSVNGHYITLYCTTDSSATILGATAYTATSVQTDATLSGTFTIAAAKSYQLRHNFSTSVGNGMGLALSGSTIAAELEIEKVG